MKASEVLKRYAAGERNFRGANLRGQSFEGQNLEGANFSKADIRSADFTDAILAGANFTAAKCGLQRRWAIVLVILSWLLAGVSGFLLIFCGYFVSLIFDSNSLEDQIAGWASLIVLIVFLIVALRWSIVAGAFAIVVSGALTGVVAVAGAFAFAVAGLVAGLVTVSGAGAVAGLVTVTVSGAVSGALTGAVSGVVALTGAGALAGVVSGVVALTGAVSGVVSGVVALTGAVSGVVSGIYIGWRALKEDKRDAWVRSFAIAFAAIGGTSFRGANLTNANFSSAKLKSTDLRKATLTGVRWYGAKMLDSVRPGDTYLQYSQVRQWLIGKGKNKNLDGQSLRGINLQGADLKDASFIGADLSEANLQDANLYRAKLVQTQLDKTDFTGATLTGACIEDWGITADTELHRVRCEYVFMRLPTKEDPNRRRKPDNESEEFKGDDFAHFIKPIKDTLDLYHSQGVDPRAIAISWKKLAENHPEANLRFAAMEVKGEDNLLLRLKTAHNADLSRLNAEYFDTYNQLKALTEAEYKKLIAEKDNRIQNLENMVNTALKRPSFYAEHYNHQGDNQVTGDRKIEGDYVEGDKTDSSRNQTISGGTINNSGAGAFSLGDISGTVANTINQLPNFDNEPDKKELKELLSELQTAVLETELDEEEKAESLEQIQKIASSLSNSQDGLVKKTVKTAMKLLRGTAAALPPTASMVTICNQLPELIDKIF